MSRDWYFELIWQLQRFNEKLGVIGQACVIALILILLFYGLLVLPKETRITQLNNALSTAPVVSIADPNAHKIKELNTFQFQFPALAVRSNAVSQWMNITQQHGLELDNINYRTTHKEHDAFHHYGVEFSFNSSYPEAHDYLSDVLSTMPFVSIDYLEIKRPTISQPEVKTNLKLAFHFIDPAPDSPVFNYEDDR